MTRAWPARHQGKAMKDFKRRKLSAYFRKLKVSPTTILYRSTALKVLTYKLYDLNPLKHRKSWPANVASARHNWRTVISSRVVKERNDLVQTMTRGPTPRERRLSQRQEIFTVGRSINITNIIQTTSTGDHKHLHPLVVTEQT